MELIHSLIIAALAGSSVYCLLRRSVVKFVLGIVLLGQAVNLLVFTAGGLVRTEPPIIEAEATTIVQPYADPLPQALVLTAIVIGFGLIAFTLALAHRACQAVGTDDLDAFTNTER